MSDLKRSTNIPFSAIFTLVIVVFIGRLLIICFTIDRGFDFGDEGDLLLMYKEYQMYSYNFFAHISHLLYLPQFNPIIQYRVYKYLCDFLACNFLAWGIYFWAQSLYIYNDRNYKIRGFLFILSFGLSGFALSPYSPNITYNDYTNLFMSLLVGCWLYLLSLQRAKKGWVTELLICILMGLVFYIQLAIKMEISLLMGVILLLSLLILSDRKVGIKLAYFAAMALGFHIINFVGFFSGGSFDPTSYQEVSGKLKQEALYSVRDILLNYWQNDAYHLLIILSFAFVFYLARFILKSIVAKDFLSVTIAALISLTGAKLFLHLSFYQLQLDIQICALLALLTIWILNLYSGPDTSALSRKNIFALALLVLLPLLLIAGTNSPLSEALPLVSLPWFVCAGALLISLLQNLKTKTFAYSIIAVIVLSTSFQFWYNRVSHPFMLKQSIFENHTANKYLYGIKTDTATIAFCRNINELIVQHGYTKGDTIVSMGFTSGVPYMLDARMELTSFYLPDGWGDRYNCFCLKNIQSRAKFILLPTDQLLKTDACLSERGYSLLSNYSFVDSVYNPYANTYYHNQTPFLRMYKRLR